MPFLEVVKWVGTACIVLAAGFRGLGLNDVDVAFSIGGAALWTYAAIEMHDRPLTFVNVFVAVAIISGLFFR